MKVKLSITTGKPQDYPKMAKPIRAQTPKDTYGLGAGHWKPGQLPVGGFQSMYCFSDNYDSKSSPTSKPESRRG